MFYRRNHREVGCVIDCLHKHKLTVSHADNHLFHLTIVSNRFPPIPLCSGWSAHLRLQLDSTNCRLHKCRSQGRSAFRVVRRPPALWMVSLMRVTTVAIYLADCGSMISLSALTQPEVVPFRPYWTHPERLRHREIVPPYKSRVTSWAPFHHLPSSRVFISSKANGSEAGNREKSMIRTL